MVVGKGGEKQSNYFNWLLMVRLLRSTRNDIFFWTFYGIIINDHLQVLRPCALKLNTKENGAGPSLGRASPASTTYLSLSRTAND